MMTADELQKLADKQVGQLIVADIDGLDAEMTVKEVMEILPEGVDPATWLPSAGKVETQVAHIDDARAEYFASDVVPAKFKRLLEAVAEKPQP